MKESKRIIIQKKLFSIALVFAMGLSLFISPISIIQALSQDDIQTIEYELVETTSIEEQNLIEAASLSIVDETHVEEISIELENSLEEDIETLEYLETTSISDVGYDISIKEEVYQSQMTLSRSPLTRADFTIAITSEQDIMDALAASSPGDTLNLILQNDIILASTTAYILIDNRNIVLSSAGATNFVIQTTNTTSSNANTGNRQTSENRHFVLNNGASMVINNVTIQGRNTVVNVNYTSLLPGGGIIVSASTLTLNQGAIVRYNVGGATGAQPYRTPGGGIALTGDPSNVGSTRLIINGGVITNNRVGSNVSDGTGIRDGGGVYAYYSTIIMNSGSIDNNYIGNDGYNNDGGAGVYLIGSTFTMNGGTITQNVNTYGSGAGVSVFGGSTFIMNDGEISYNSNTSRTSGTGTGGGVLVTDGTSTAPSSFTMNGGIIRNNSANNAGGVFLNPNYTLSGSTYNFSNPYNFFTMNGGTFSGNTAASNAGALGVGVLSTAVINAGIFENNTAAFGGAILNSIGNLTIAGNITESTVVFRNNQATGTVPAGMSGNYGGAIYIRIEPGTIAPSTLGPVTNITGALFEGNSATLGGAIFLDDINYPNARLSQTNIASSIFNNNTAAQGGGIFTELTSINVRNNTKFTNNVATQDGGGIYVSLAGPPASPYLGYAGLNTDNTTIFSGNTAATRAVPPYNASTLYPNLQFASLSPDFSNSPVNAHSLNNYDINYTGTPLTLTFNANAGNAGSVPGTINYLGTSYTVVLPQTIPTRYGYDFKGWTTNAAGTGTLYQASTSETVSNYTMPSTNTTLYAQWDPHPYAIFFDDGFPITTDVKVNETLTGVDYASTVDLTGLNPTGTLVLSGEEVDVNDAFTFTGWLIVVNNPTQYESDDPILLLDGTIVAPEGSFAMPAGNITLVAQWSPQAFQINYHDYDGETLETQVTQYGDDNTARTGLTHEGLVFAGWNTRADRSGTIYQPGATITWNSSLDLDGSGQLNLYPMWDVQVTFKVVNGSWSDSTVTDKTVTIPRGSALTSIPIGMIANTGYTQNPGSWDVVPNTTTNLTTATTYTFTFTINTYTVTFNVVGGTWADGTSTPKVINLTHGSTLTALDVPSGMLPSSGYDGTTGTWNVTPVGSSVIGNLVFNFTFVPYNNILVTFNLTVEGASVQNFTLTQSIQAGTSVNDNSIDYLNFSNFSNFDTFINSGIFAGFSTEQSHVLVTSNDWTNSDSLTLDSELSQDTIFNATMYLRRFRVTFSDPSFSLFGDTVQVPFGSNLVEPAIHIERYQVPVNSTHGWFEGIFLTRDDAASALDDVSRATPQMPGHVPALQDNPTDARLQALAARNLVISTPNSFAFVPDVIANPLSSNIEAQSVSIRDTSNATQFIFTGNEPEDANATHSLNATLVTQDKVLTRVITLLETTPPVEDVLGATRTPNIPQTGNIAIALFAISSIIGFALIIKKNRIN